MSYQLSEGSLAVILAGGNVEDPVMQILGHKKIAGTSASSDRFRLLVSDGKHLNSFAMLATQLNDKVTSGELCDFTVIQITRYITSMVSNADRGDKRVMVILGVKVLAMGTEVGFKIGDPKPLSESGEADKNAVKQQQTIRPIQHKPTVNQPMNNVNNASSVLASPGGSVHTHPISSLSPYQNKWVIKARVTSKSPVRTWANARGEGKLFSMDLVDESGEIRATAFKEQCDKFYDIIEEGDSQTTQSEDGESDVEYDHHDETRVNENEATANTSSSTIPSTPRRTAKKRKFDEFVSTVIETMKAIAASKQKRLLQCGNRDGFDVFGELIAIELRQIQDPVVCETLKLNIQKLIHDAKIAQLMPITSLCDN